RDLVATQSKGSRVVRPVVRPVLIAPATKPAGELLEEMRARRRQLAVVLDEYGGTAGIVTLENLFEALVGPIHEEKGSDDDRDSGVDVVPEPDGSLILDGLTRLEELEELTDVRVHPDRRAEVDTIGGLVMAELGRVPKPGDEVALGGYRLRVEAVDGRRVAAVR